MIRSGVTKHKNGTERNGIKIIPEWNEISKNGTEIYLNEPEWGGMTPK